MRDKIVVVVWMCWVVVYLCWSCVVQPSKFYLVSNEDEHAVIMVKRSSYTSLDEMIAVKCPGLVLTGDRTKRCDPGRGAKVVRWDGKRIMRYEELRYGETYQMVFAESNFYYSAQLLNKGWFTNANGIRMRMISVVPRALEVDVTGLVTPEMRAEIIASAVGGMERSMVGDANRKGHSKLRTSENTFDNVTKSAARVKELAFLALALEEEGRSEAPQVVKYNPGQFYMPHHDYFYNPEPGPPHNKTNRMATFFVYLNELEGDDPGGETIFPKRADWSDYFAWNLDNFLGECVPSAENFKFRGGVGKALLFYSQTPSGELDRMSEHAACPPLKNNTKWGVNIWVWNRDMSNEKKKLPPVAAQITLKNGFNKKARVYWHKGIKEGGSGICVNKGDEDECPFVVEIGPEGETYLVSYPDHVFHSYDEEGNYMESFRVGGEALKPVE